MNELPAALDTAGGSAIHLKNAPGNVSADDVAFFVKGRSDVNRWFFHLELIVGGKPVFIDAGDVTFFEKNGDVFCDSGGMPDDAVLSAIPQVVHHLAHDSAL